MPASWSPHTFSLVGREEMRRRQCRFSTERWNPEASVQLWTGSTILLVPGVGEGLEDTLGPWWSFDIRNLISCLWSAPFPQGHAHPLTPESLWEPRLPRSFLLLVVPPTPDPLPVQVSQLCPPTAFLSTVKLFVALCVIKVIPTKVIHSSLNDP